MPIGTAFLRIITALILSIPVLLSFAYFLVGNAIQNTVLQPGYVTEAVVTYPGWQNGVNQLLTSHAD